MPTLSGIQLGPTGRSVSGSYGATLSKLRPAGWCFVQEMCSTSDPSSVGSTTGIPDGSGDLTDDEKRYQAAMEWLLEKDPEHPNQSHIDLYKEKQANYTDAFERKIKAFDDALDRITHDYRFPTLKDQREAYERWVQENQKTYNNHIQAAYMDWVTTGKKEEVEYYFAVVDNESAMSRVEASKVRAGEVGRLAGLTSSAERNAQCDHQRSRWYCGVQQGPFDPLQLVMSNAFANVRPY